MAMEFLFTKHALRRYTERYDTSLSLDSARYTLKQKVKNATPLKEKTWAGDEKWLIRDPDCVLITRRDKDINKIVCVTIVKPSNHNTDIPPDELEIIQEWGRAQNKNKEIEELESESSKLIEMFEKFDHATLSSTEVRQFQTQILKNDYRIERVKQEIFSSYFANKKHKENIKKLESENEDLKKIIRLLQFELDSVLVLLENDNKQEAMTRIKNCLII